MNIISSQLFTISAIIPSFLILIIYTLQKKKNNLLSKFFKLIIAVNIAVIIAELFYTFVIYNNLYNLASTIMKIHQTIEIFINYLVGMYYYLMLINIENITLKDLFKTKKEYKFFTIVTVIFALTIIILPASDFVPGVTDFFSMPHGAIVVAYDLMLVTFLIIMMTKYKAGTKDNRVFLLSESILFVLYGFCQIMFQDVAFSSMFNSMILLMIYILVENPDIYISRELNNQEQNIQNINNTNSYLMNALKKEIVYKINQINVLLKDYQAKNLTKEELMPKLEKINFELKSLNGEVCNTVALILNDETDNTEVEIGLNKYLDRFYELTSNLINSTNISYRLDVLESTPSKVLINTDDLFFTMLGMFKNALNSTELGEIIFTIGSETVDGRHFLTLKCNDTGKGFTKDELTELQTVLSNESLIDKYDKNIIILSKRRKIYGGKVSVDSFEGAGSIVNASIEYGFVDNTKIPRKIIDKAPSLNKEFKNYNGQTALILGSVNISGKEMLKMYNIDADETEDPVDTLNLLKQGKKYDWIFLNLANPGAADAAKAINSLSRNFNYSIPYVAAVIPYKTKQYRQIINNNPIINDYIIEPLELIDLNTILEKTRRD